MEKPVICILHGGLGNQLFQFFAARVIANHTGKRLVVSTSVLTKYSRAADLELPNLFNHGYLTDSATFVKSTNPIYELARPAKLLSKLLNTDCILATPSGSIYLDSYFQDFRYLLRYEPALVLSELIQMRSAIVTQDLLDPYSKYLFHLRLGDFFDLTDQKYHCVKNMVSYAKSLSKPVDFISNDETVVNMYVRACGAGASVRVVPTTDLPAASLLKLMMTYDYVHTNGSSLAAWAALLSNSVLLTTNTLQHYLYLYLASLENNMA